MVPKTKYTTVSDLTNVTTQRNYHTLTVLDIICLLMHCKTKLGASLVAQWLRICLPMQGTRVRALVWEDPTCRGATNPVSHNY